MTQPSTQKGTPRRWLRFPWEDGAWEVDVLRIDTVPDGPRVSREVVWVKHVSPKPGWTVDPFPVDAEWLGEAPHA